MPDAFFQKKRKRSSTASANRNTSSSSRQSTTKKSKRPDGDDDDHDDQAADQAGDIHDLDLTHTYHHDLDSEDEAEAAETPAEARLRLAKLYLDGLKSNQQDFLHGPDAAQADRDNIAARLQKDVSEQGGKLHVFVSRRLARSNPTILAVRGHRLSVTCAVASADAKSLFTSGKEGSIIRWRLTDGKRIRVLPKRSRVIEQNTTMPPLNQSKRSSTSGAARRRERSKAKGKARASEPTNHHNSTTDPAPDIGGYLTIGADEGHTDEVWSLAVSHDGRYLASGGKDRRIGIWSISSHPAAGGHDEGSEKWLKALGGHKDAISSLAFRPGSSELYSASYDRTLKLFDVSQLSYIETLFGHQESILSMSCLKAETAVSAGGRDRTCRFWKIRDESQLVFRAGGKSKLREVLEGGDLLKLEAKENEGKSGGGGGVQQKKETELIEGSVDCVAMIDDQNFLSGGDSGSISLWNLGKKKPVYTRAAVHGMEEHVSESEGTILTPRWITSLACLPYGDVFASGSWDGSVRLWSLDPRLRSFHPLLEIPAVGFVNSLQLISPPASTAFVDEHGATQSSAIQPHAWKRQNGLHPTNDAGVDHVASSNGIVPDGQAGLVREEEEGDMAQQHSATVRGSKEAVPPILVVGLGQEPRVGRWSKIKEARNGALVVPLRFA
ncbi:WD40 repeat-like protein [Violaceomyces palustris]|uniref:WD40 repeat-like protein n=1 Tax=Violaceomyces palustris TaxID=1673888 RepID=A0ACD0NUV9_9BASI|nr:WD40 repeat-like protein [Violaceomyces palustris]